MKFRRSPHLVGVWNHAGSVVTNYRTGREAALTPDILRILNALGEWTSAEEVARAVALPIEPIRAILEALAEMSFVIAGCDDHPPQDPWLAWGPAAGYFHFSTRGTRFNDNVAEGEARLMNKATTEPPPPPTRSRTAATRVALPSGRPASQLERILVERRTWREFAPTPVALDDLADLLRLSVGVQQWASGPARNRVALKTAPSGGICHPIEAYVVASRVKGLPAGIYHYDSAQHDLACLRKGAGARLVNTFIQAQPWYGRAPLVVLFTAVFERTMWRYPVAKAYRNVLLEAGHICQTFYLVATERQLAPFCTQALDEGAIDRALEIDAVTEGVVYAAGCGRRPSKGWTLGLPALEGWGDAGSGR